MGNIISGEAKREKEKEREEAMIAKEAVADVERLKLGPTAIWTGLVTHHKDVFASHVMPKLDATDRFFFSTRRAIQKYLYDATPTRSKSARKKKKKKNNKARDSPITRSS